MSVHHAVQSSDCRLLTFWSILLMYSFTQYISYSLNMLYKCAHMHRYQILFGQETKHGASSRFSIYWYLFLIPSQWLTYSPFLSLSVSQLRCGMPLFVHLSRYTRVVPRPLPDFILQKFGSGLGTRL